MERNSVSLGALALLAAQVTVFAQPQTGSFTGGSKATILGPEGGLLPLAPVVLLYERAEGVEAEAEPGRLFTVGTLPAPPAGNPRLLRFSAAGASAYRLHLEDVALPEGVRMYLYGIDAAGKVTRTFGPYEKSGPLADGSFRSRVVPGIEVVLEIQDMAAGPWPLRIPRVSAMDAAMLAELEAAKDPGLTETAEQRRAPRGERLEVEVDGKVVRAEVVEGDVVLEGDIVLGSVGDLAAAGKGEGGRSRFAVMRTESSGRWPGGVIPFDGALRNDPRVVAAMQSWTQRTNGVITFVPRSNEASFMRFSSTSGNICSSGVGRTSGARTINVAQPCPTGTLIHEIGHALGFHHEQSREDRDNFVRIIWENIEDGRDHNFEKAAGDANSDLGSYDFGSIMHYPLTAFSTNGERTIEPKVPIPAGVTPGQRSAPSAGDVRALNIQYGVLVSKSNFQVTAAGGTFTVNVTAPSDRFWVVTDDADWVSVISGGQGTGNGTIQFRVSPNEMVLSSLVIAPGPRTARLRIALTPALLINATVEIVQAPPGCSFTVSPSRITAPAQGGAFPVTVTTSPGCTWGAAESLTWVTMSALSGQGSATISVRLSANNQVNKLGVAPRRTGTIQVAGKQVAIEQEGVDTQP
ncbi:MAG: hypothetical protein JNK87_21490 [Bryobacterales bacterium]|nr:hypothetical protein [Bryobacterales bacterium]